MRGDPDAARMLARMRASSSAPRDRRARGSLDWLAPVLALGGATCGPEVGGGPLPWPEDARVALFALEPEGARAPTFAFFDGAELSGAEEVALPRGGAAAVLGFSETLDALQVDAGRFDPLSLRAEPCDDLRPRALPRERLARIAGPSGWTSTATRPPVFRGVALLPLDVDRCFSEGGCPTASLGACGPCAPIPSPRPVRAPASPARPEVCPGCPGGMSPRRAECPAGALFDVGQGGCRPLGRSCPAGRFDEEPAADALFVDPEAPPDGDGSRESPFLDLAEAVRWAGPGGRIVLSRGTHRVSSPLVLSNVRLQGACAVDTRVEGILELAGSSTLAEIHLLGQLLVSAGGRLVARSLFVEASGGEGALGIDVLGALSAEGLKSLGNLKVGPSGRLVLVLGDLRGSTPLQVEGGQADLRRLVLSGEGAPRGHLVTLLGEAPRLRLSEARLDPEGTGGIQVGGRGIVELFDLFAEGTEVGRAIELLPASTASIARARLDGFGDVFLGAYRADLSVRDVVVADRAPSEPSTALVLAGGQLDVRRMRIEGRFENAVAVGEDELNQAVADARIEDLEVEGAPDLPVSIGVVIRAAAARLARVRLAGLRTHGLLVAGRPLPIDIEDLSIEGPVEMGILGNDSVVEEDQVTLEAVRIEGAQIAVKLDRLGFRFSDLLVRGGRTGVVVAPIIGIGPSAGLRFERARLEGLEFALSLERLEPAFGGLVELRALHIEDAGTAVTLSSCWPDQGRLFSAMGMRAVRQAVSFASRP